MSLPRLQINKILSNETLRNGVFFTVFSFINKGINFILLILLARYITPAEYGYWSLFGTIVMFMGYFIAMTTEGYLSISFFKEGMGGVQKTFSCVFSTSLIVAFIFSVFTWLFQPILSNRLDVPWRYLYLAIGISFFTIYSNICLDFLRVKKKILFYGIFSCCSAILILGLSIFFVKFMLIGWFGCILAQLLCVCLFGFIGFIFFLQMGCLAFPEKKHWKMILLWGIPLIPHLATGFIRFGCDRYIVNHFYSVEDVGYFSFAVALTTAIVMIGSGFNDANSVNIFEILGNNDYSSERKIAILNKQKKMIFLVYLVCSILVSTLCYFLVPLFLPQYTQAMKYFIILAFYGFFQCVYFLYTNFLFFFKGTKQLMTITFSCALLHLVLSLLLTRFSIYYTCVVSCFTQICIVFFVRKNAIKTLEDNLNCKVRIF